MILFLLGLVSLLAQVVLLREVTVAFYGIELAYLFALAAWLAGTAAGASLPPRRVVVPSRGTTWLLIAACVALPFQVAFIRASRQLLGGVPGAYLPIDRQLVALVVAVAPVASLLGLAFRWAARAHVAGGGRLSGAYAVESAGAALGGLASTFAFRAGVQTFALAVGTTGIGLAWLAACGMRRPARRAGVAIALLAAGLVGAWRSEALDRRMTAWNHPTLVETRDTPYARVSISQNGPQISVFENDVLAFDSETADNEALPHLVALQHPAPEAILLLGGSAERMDRELWRHHPSRLEHVELDGAMVAAVGRHIKDERANAPPMPAGSVNRPSHDDEETLVRIADPRATLAASGRYDIIVVALPGPVSGQANRFYTRDFFEECARHLAPSGVLGLRLQVPENYLAPAALLPAASVAQALRASFGFVEFLQGAQTIVLASRTALPSQEIVVERLLSRSLGTRLVTAPYVRYLYTNDRRQELREALVTARVPVNRDAHPVSYLYAAIGWLTKFFPGLIGSDLAALAQPGEWPAAWRWGPAAAIVLLFAAARRTNRTRRVALALTAGLAGMALETVVLLNYQSSHGALFEDVGTLVMAFMAGSAAGAWVVGASAGSRWRRAFVPASAAGPWAPGGLRRHPRPTAALLLVALAACSLLAAWFTTSGAAPGLAGSTLLLGAIGALVAGLFACASWMVETHDEAGMGRLYGADLVGGCAGSLAASLVLVPLAGMDVTALLVAAFAVIALLLA